MQHGRRNVAVGARRFGLTWMGAVLLLQSVPDREKKLIYFTGIDEARFRQPVVPGDQIRFELEVLRQKPKIAKVRGQAYVGDKLVATAVLTSFIVDR